MKLSSLNKVYFLGIGGIGMSAIARFFQKNGVQVYGYDRTSSPLTRCLEQEGIIIHYEEQEDIINESLDLVVYTPAIPKTNKEYMGFVENGFKMMKRSQVLGLICENYTAIAVAGTHGKTTVTSMITHLLHHAGLNISAFVGGIMSNYSTNYIGSDKTDYVIVEADEFDRSFLSLYPDYAVITSMDADHLDIYGSKESLEATFCDFASQIKPNGHLFLRKGLHLPDFSAKKHSYGIGDKQSANFISSNLRVLDGKIYFDYSSSSHCINDLHIGMPGKHNVENACAAISIALQLGVSEVQIRDGLASFKGVKRRFEYLFESKDISYIDDYAHHPEELDAAIKSARLMYPDRSIIGVFQPHLYSRTNDFYKEFALALSQLDYLYLLDIYPARELPISGVDSNMILQLMDQDKAELIMKDEVVDRVALHKNALIMTLGAGDIDQLILPIKEKLKEKF